MIMRPGRNINSDSIENVIREYITRPYNPCRSVGEVYDILLPCAWWCTKTESEFYHVVMNTCYTFKKEGIAPGLILDGFEREPERYESSYEDFCAYHKDRLSKWPSRSNKK